VLDVTLLPLRKRAQAVGDLHPIVNTQEIWKRGAVICVDITDARGPFGITANANECRDKTVRPLRPLDVSLQPQRELVRQSWNSQEVNLQCMRNIL